uniref:Putative secreted protein n=1 Tax=Anopheles marajoara TaxID=58244 RepID=A0A2M4C7R6_9DIPT
MQLIEMNLVALNLIQQFLVLCNLFQSLFAIVNVQRVVCHELERNLQQPLLNLLKKMAIRKRIKQPKSDITSVISPCVSGIVSNTASVVSIPIRRCVASSLRTNPNESTARPDRSKKS